MPTDEFDITSLLTLDDQLPRPQWDLLQSSIDAREAADPSTIWTDALRQWLAELGPAIRRGYQTYESASFLGLAWAPDRFGDSLLTFAEGCRASLMSVLGEVADFQLPGKQVILAFRSADDYYRYVSLFYPEGEFGGSGGMHIREGYPHVAVHGKLLAIQENVLAHELTHASLHHLTLPQWLEEGLAQMFEHDMTNRAQLVVDSEMANRHKRYWSNNGLDEFWYGSGFSKSGKVQTLSYQLAEILVRLLLDECRPRWFGWDQTPKKRLIAFLQNARAEDGGASAILDHVGFSLTDLATKFLGPGAWAPSL